MARATEALKPATLGLSYTTELAHAVPPVSGLPMKVTRFSGPSTVESPNALEVMEFRNSSDVTLPSRTRPQSRCDTPTQAARENTGSAATFTGAGRASLRPVAPESLRTKDDSSNCADSPPPRSSVPRTPQWLVDMPPPSSLVTARSCALMPAAGPAKWPTAASTRPYSCRPGPAAGWACAASVAADRAAAVPTARVQRRRARGWKRWGVGEVRGFMVSFDG